MLFHELTSAESERMNPFEVYPGAGRVLLGKPKNTSNCRYGYGLELQRLNGQTNCAYCQVSLIDDYYHWLLMAVDHVVPKGRSKTIAYSFGLF